MGTKNATSRMTASKLLAMLLTPALALTMAPTIALAGTTGDDGASYCADSTIPNAPDCATVEWNGLTWDIIGYNYQGAKHGVAGDTINTVTLLLDEEEIYEFPSSLFTAFDETRKPDDSNEYTGSDLQSKMSSTYSNLTDKSNIVSRTLIGSSTSCIDAEGYNANTIAGAQATNENLWPLSVTEASQLKVSVRKFWNMSWWLRSPGDSSYDAAFVGDYEYGFDDYPNSGYVHVSGYRLYFSYAARPALYLNLSSSIFAPLSGVISGSTLNIGAYDETLKVTDGDGYTWDIVGVNGTVNRGVPAPSGYATLLLSNSSAKKFGFPNQSYYAGHIYGEYDPADSHSNGYATSDLKNALAFAYDELKNKPEYSGKIQTRDLESGGSYDDDSEKVAGAAVDSQGFWPLSVTEAKILANQQRIFGSDWWLRSPGLYSYYATTVDGGGEIHTAVRVDNSQAAARPALYLNLSSSLFTSLSSGWQERVGSTYSGTEGGSLVKRTVTFNPNGGTISSPTKTIDNNTAIGTLPVPTRANYSFEGWYTAKNGGAKISASTVITANTTYYAHWQASKPKAGAPSAIVNHVDFKKHVKITAPAKKSIKKKKSASIKLTAFKNVAVKSIKLDKAAKKLKLKVTKAKNSIKVKAGKKNGKAKITIVLANGNKKTVTITVR